MPAPTKMVYLLGGTITLLGLIGFSSFRPKAHTSNHVEKPVAALAATTTPAVQLPKPARATGTETGKFKDAVVLVDGKPTAITAYSEMPLGLPRYTRTNDEGTVSAPRFFRMYEYIAALGVDPRRIKTIHVSGSRVAVIDGDELIKNKDSIVFDFSGETEGKPRMRWSTAGLRHGTRVDLFRSIAVYIEKPAPVWSDADSTLTLNGKELDAPPYVTEPMPKGTRFYVDGRLVGTAKRRLLSETLAVNPKDSVSRFSFTRYIESLGVRIDEVKHVDFLAKDSLAYRANSETLKSRDTLVFTMPNHAKGKAQAHLPERKTTRVSSVQVFVKTSPPDRKVDPGAVDDEFEPGREPTPSRDDDKNDSDSGEGPE